MIDIFLATPLNQRQELFLSLFPEFGPLDEPARRVFLLDLLASQDLEPCREQIAGDLLAATRLNELLPDLYADFRPIVEDGVRFLLSRLETPRLRDLMAEQFLLPVDAPAGQRLQCLARQLPTLHKLGQIIARNRAIEPGFRTWLQGLESAVARSSFADIRASLIAELALHPEAPVVVFDPEPLAEASVGIVIGFRMPKVRHGDPILGVAKLVKPGVVEHLQEEIALLDQLAVHFDQRKEQYPLRDFGYARVFAEVKESLCQEVDLAHEQRNLELARRFFADCPDVEIPQALSWSTGRLTLMTRIHGEALDRSSFDQHERAMAARSLFDALIGKTLFSSEEKALFHGDPHAGNLLLCKAKDGRCSLGILDWSQAGHLHRRQRQGFLQLAFGLATRDVSRAQSALRSLVLESLDGHPRLDELHRRVRIACSEQGDPSGAVQKTGLLARTLDLIDTLALGGFAFPGELLWFRKSLFTLIGVLQDLDPGFDADLQLRQWLQELILQDLPKRLVTGFNPLMDHPAGYRSFVSNLDLCGLVHHVLLSGAAEGWRFQRSAAQQTLERTSGLARRFWFPFGQTESGISSDSSAG